MGLGKRDQHDEWAIPRSGLSPIRRSVLPLCVAMLLFGCLILGASSAIATAGSDGGGIDGRRQVPPRQEHQLGALICHLDLGPVLGYRP